MRIELRLAPERLRRWQAYLAERLAAIPGTAVTVVPAASADPLPAGAELLFRLEALIGGPRAGHALERVEPGDLAALRRGSGAADVPDLAIDLTGGAPERPAVPTLYLLCDGQPFERGALAAVLDGRAPSVAVTLAGTEGERTLSLFSPAVESPRSATASFGMLAGRAAAEIVHAVGRLQRGAPLPGGSSPKRAEAGTGIGGFFASSLAARVQSRLQRLLETAPDWYVAWRPRRGGEGLPDIGAGGFHRLDDDGSRFYADPFLIEEGGRRFLFVEEFPYATQRGLISAAEIDGEGKVSTIRPVLETTCHLSYPFLFRHAGGIYMIPETSERRTVELYRADPFPDRWVLDRVLVEGADLGDATLVERDGRWWMFVASRERWTSSWDALALYEAPSPFGPFTAHPDNPVLVDLREARPAGTMLDLGGRLVRPVQDCAGGYGAALGFAEVTTLSRDAFGQSIRARIAPDPPDSGLHTYNRSETLEVIDRFGPRAGGTRSPAA